MPTGYYTHPEFLLHEMGHFHPECPERLQAIEDHLISHGMVGLLDRREASAATAEQIGRVHLPQYIATLAAASVAMYCGRCTRPICSAVAALASRRSSRPTMPCEIK